MEFPRSHEPDGKADDSLTNGRSGASSDFTDRASGEFYLGGWRVRPSQNRLSAARGEIVLEPKAMDVLVRLAAARGETVGREELLNAVWPGVFVADDSLHRAVSRLRRALATRDELKKAIITVPKRGYRLDGALLGDASAEAAPADAPSSVSAAPRIDWRIVLAGGAGVAAIAAFAIIQFLSSPTADFSNVRSIPFTGYAGQERAASFSPDGERAVFAWAGENGDNWDLYIKSVDEWSPTRLTFDPGPDYNPAWSPDGETIAFVRLGGAEGCRIMMIPAGGGEASTLRLCRAGYDVDLSWGPDSLSLYFTDRIGSNGPSAVHSMDLSSRAVRQVTFPPSDYWGDNLVRLSPDGDEIAFARTRALGVTDIYVASLDDGDERQVTDDRLKIHGIAWSGDGESLYFSSNRGGSFGLWSVDAAGGRPQPVTTGVNADSVAVSPDGRRLIYESETTSTSLWIASLDEPAAAPEKLTRASGWDWHPAASPDGTKLAFISDRSGSPELWVVSATGENPKKLTDFGGPYSNSPAWSPDGRRIVVTSPVNGNFDLYVVDPETGDIERLTDHPASDRNPAWSADGEAIYFGSNRTGRWEIWRLTLGDGASEQITTNGGFRAQQAANGDLLYVKREAAGLFLLAAGSGAGEILLTDRLLPLDWNNWQVIGSTVRLVTRDDAGGTSIAALDVASRSLTREREIENFPYNSGLGVMPDGLSVIFTRPEVVEADLVLMEGFSDR